MVKGKFIVSGELSTLITMALVLFDTLHNTTFITLYDPSCWTWQERTASLPATTVLFSTSSVNSGSWSSPRSAGDHNTIIII